MWKSVATVVATVALSLLCVSSWAAQPARLAHKAPPIGIKVVPVNGDVASLLNLRPAVAFWWFSFCRTARLRRQGSRETM